MADVRPGVRPFCYGQSTWADDLTLGRTIRLLKSLLGVRHNPEYWALGCLLGVRDSPEHWVLGITLNIVNKCYVNK